MSSLIESARWFLFAVKADEERRTTYTRWIDALRGVEINRRRAALDLLPPPAVEIPPMVGHVTPDDASTADSAAVVAEAQRLRTTVFRAERGDGKPYLVDHAVTALDSSSPLLSFALSDGVVSAAARYLGMVPILTGITILASPYVPSEGFAGSQLFHSDWEASRQVKVFVLCSEVERKNGPLTAVTAEASTRVKAAVGYHYGGPAFRLPDEEVLTRIESDSLSAFVGPVGAVTFIDTSSCLHFGSRVEAGASERLVAQFQYLTPSAFDLQLGRRRRPFARTRGEFTPVQRLVLGATR